jgi:putative endonuclease
VVPQRTIRRIPGSSAAHIYELASVGLRRLVSRLGGIKGFLDGDFRRRTGRALGDHGERLAARRLRRDGYRIVERNFRAAGAEIDVVALDGDTLVFIEVKTRLGSGAGRPEDSVHALKQHRIRRAAAIFARTRAMEECPMRFDVVAVSRQQGRWRLEIIKDAF